MAQNKVILVVEDEAVLADLIKEGIESHRVKVDIAANGAEAIELMKKNKFDVILTDASMPVMDGKSMVKLAHQENLLDESCRVVFLTGAVDGVFSEEELGMAWFKACELLAKPVSTEHLKARLGLN